MNAYVNPIKSFAVAPGVTVECKAIDNPEDEAPFAITMSVDIDGTVVSIEPSYYDAAERNHTFNQINQVSAEGIYQSAVNMLMNPEQFIQEG